MTTKKNNKKGCLTAILQIFGSKAKEPVIENLPYRVRDNFLSPAELSFYRVLESVVGKHFEICAKVRLADIFYVVQPNKNMSYFNRISQRHIDFLVCQPDTMKPVLALELDDVSHSRSDRQERDEFVDQVFKTARLALVHIPAQRAYNTRDLAARLSPYLPVDEQSETNITGEKIRVNASAAEIPNCPKCGSSMVLRMVSKGDHQGKQFFGCSTFPKCRGVLPHSQ